MVDFSKFFDTHNRFSSTRGADNEISGNEVDDYEQVLKSYVRHIVFDKRYPDILQAGVALLEPVMDVEHVAQAVLQMALLPLDTNVQFMTIMASKMPYIGRG